jgi:ribose transport system permease protein
LDVKAGARALIPARSSIEWLGLAGAIAVGSLVLAALSPAFLTPFNLYVLLRSVCVSTIVAFAQMVTLAVGQMNLSIGGLGGMVAILFGAMLSALGLTLWLATPAALLIGLAAGLLNGFLITRSGVNGFVVTLATGSIFLGVNLGITQSKPYYDMPSALQEFGDGRIGAFPYLLIAPIAVTPVLALFLFRMPLGRRLLAVGGNSHAATLSGISADAMIVLAHALSGLLAGVAAVLAVAQLGSAQPLIGADWLLLSFAAPVIGGAVLGGGHVSVVGTVLAVLVIGLIQNGLVLARVDPYWVQFLLGALIFAAVGLNRWRAKPAKRART